MRTGKEHRPEPCQLRSGHDVTLATCGNAVLVDRTPSLEKPFITGKLPIRGYDPTPMSGPVERLHLSRQPQQIAALAAFIEQIGQKPAERRGRNYGHTTRFQRSRFGQGPALPQQAKRWPLSARMTYRRPEGLEEPIAAVLARFHASSSVACPSHPGRCSWHL